MRILGHRNKETSKESFKTLQSCKESFESLEPWEYLEFLKSYIGEIRLKCSLAAPCESKGGVGGG